MNRRSIFNEEEAVEAGAHGGRGGHVHVEPSGGDAGGTADREGRAWRRQTSVKAHRTTGDGTGAPQWRVRERRSRLAH